MRRVGDVNAPVGSRRELVAVAKLRRVGVGGVLGVHGFGFRKVELLRLLRIDFFY